MIKALLFLFLALGSVLNASAIVQTDPALPECMATEAAMISWIKQVVHDSPPAGGDIQVLRHWEPKYAKNDKVGEIWILPSVIKIEIDGSVGYAQVFLVYHCETKESEVKIALPIAPDDLPKFLEETDKTSAFLMPTHPKLAFTFPTKP